MSRSGARRHPRVRRDHQRDLVRAARAAPVRPRPDLDVELGVGHRQLGQPLADRGGERRRRLVPARGQLAGEPVELGPRLAKRRLDLRQGDLGPLQLLAACAAALGVGEHVGDRAPVLSLESREHRETLLDLLEPSRRCLELERVRAQGATQVLGLGAKRLGALGQARQRRVDARGDREPPGGVREHLGGATGPVLGRDRLRGAGGRAPQRLEIAQTVALHDQLGGLILGGRHALDLVELEREQIELALAAGGQLAQLRLAFLDPADPRIRPPNELAQRDLVAPAVGVEDVELDRREHQLAVLVLTVEREQHAAELAQVARPWRTCRTRTRGSGRRATPAAPARSPRRPSAAPRPPPTREGSRTRPRRRPRRRRCGRPRSRRARRAAGRAPGPAGSCRRRSRRSRR